MFSSSNLTMGSIARLGDETLLDTAEVSQVLRLDKRTLENWRSLGQGPRFTRIGARRVFYTVRDVLAFAGISA